MRIEAKTSRHALFVIPWLWMDDVFWSDGAHERRANLCWLGLSLKLYF